MWVLGAQRAGCWSTCTRRASGFDFTCTGCWVLRIAGANLPGASQPAQGSRLAAHVRPTGQPCKAIAWRAAKRWAARVAPRQRASNTDSNNAAAPPALTPSLHSFPCRSVPSWPACGTPTSCRLVAVAQPVLLLPLSTCSTNRRRRVHSGGRCRSCVFPPRHLQS